MKDFVKYIWGTCAMVSVACGIFNGLAEQWCTGSFLLILGFGMWFSLMDYINGQK